jgi:hypothetical protein
MVSEGCGILARRPGGRTGAISGEDGEKIFVSMEGKSMEINAICAGQALKCVFLISAIRREELLLKFY